MQRRPIKGPTENLALFFFTLSCSLIFSEQRLAVRYYVPCHRELLREKHNKNVMWYPYPCHIAYHVATAIERLRCLCFFFFVCIRSDFILLQWREQKKIPFMVFQIFVHSLGFAPPHFTVTTCAVDGALLGLNKNILWTLKIPWTQTHFVHKIQERKKSSKSWQRAHFHANST